MKWHLEAFNASSHQSLSFNWLESLQKVGVKYDVARETKVGAEVGAAVSQRDDKGIESRWLTVHSGFQGGIAIIPTAQYELYSKIVETLI